MAFIKVNSYGRTIILGDNRDGKGKLSVDSGQVKIFTGFLVGVKHVAKKGKAKREYTFLQMQTNDKKPEVVSVSSSGFLNWLFLDEKGNVKDSYLNKYLRITFKGRKKIKGSPQPVKEFDVEVDAAIKLKNALPF